MTIFSFSDTCCRKPFCREMWAAVTDLSEWWPHGAIAASQRCLSFIFTHVVGSCLSVQVGTRDHDENHAAAETCCEAANEGIACNDSLSILNSSFLFCLEAKRVRKQLKTASSRKQSMDDSFFSCQYTNTLDIAKHGNAVLPRYMTSFDGRKMHVAKVSLRRAAPLNLVVVGA